MVCISLSATHVTYQPCTWDSIDHKSNRKYIVDAWLPKCGSQNQKLGSNWTGAMLEDPTSQCYGCKQNFILGLCPQTGYVYSHKYLTTVVYIMAYKFEDWTMATGILIHRCRPSSCMLVVSSRDYWSYLMASVNQTVTPFSRVDHSPC